MKADAEAAPNGCSLRLPPRSLPLGLVLQLLFGGRTFLGWFLAVLGMGPVFAFVLQTDRTSLPAYDRETSARITSVWETDSGDYYVSYAFLDEASVEHRGESYADHPPPVHARWRVDYLTGDPSESCLQGMLRYPVPSLSVWLVFLFVLTIGLMILAVSLPMALRGLSLLRIGTETNGKLIGEGEIQMEIQGVPVMELTFGYEVGGKTYATMVYGPRPARLEAERSATVLYDPRAPARATTLDHIIGSWVSADGDGHTPIPIFSIGPRRAEVNASGELVSSPGSPLLLMLLPALFVGFLTATVICLI